MIVRSVFAYAGNMADARHSARALMEAGVLDAYVTSFAFREDGRLARVLALLPQPLGGKLRRQFGRRAIRDVDPRLLHAYPWWEMVRLLADKSFSSPIPSDMVWDHMSHRFDRLVARRYVPHTQAVHAYEYAALSTFERAQKEGVARVLHLPALDNRQFDEIQRREKAEWPELASSADAYFRANFEKRCERRRAEIELADLIVTNSSLTAGSHIAAGADPAKVVAVPLAAPPSIAQMRELPGGPLRVMWAGPFSIRKGAHYALQAWRLLKAGASAKLDVYGKVVVPERALVDLPPGVTFHGSVAQPELFKAYEKADVLLFPSLSDGFGLVVAEAMAHGLPVITTRDVGAADLVTRENGIVVPSGDAGALRDALLWCLDNRPRLRDMRHHALATARARQWPDFRRDFIAALQDRLGRMGYRPSYRALGAH